MPHREAIGSLSIQGGRVEEEAHMGVIHSSVTTRHALQETRVSTRQTCHLMPPIGSLGRWDP